MTYQSNPQTSGFRELSPQELEAISGGRDITVIRGISRPTFFPENPGMGHDSGVVETDRTEEGPEIIVTEKREPDKCEANPIRILVGLGTFRELPGQPSIVEGAPYYAPEKIDDAYIIKLFNHASDLSKPALLVDRISEFLKMYQDEKYEYHADFKDIESDKIVYYSSVTGERVETSPFEAFGNFLYGALMRAAGFSLFQTQAIAAGVQNLRGGADLGETVQKVIENIFSGNFRDDPLDAPHVERGWNASNQHINAGNSGLTYMSLSLDGCSANRGTGSTGGSPFSPISVNYPLGSSYGNLSNSMGRDYFIGSDYFDF